MREIRGITVIEAIVAFLIFSLLSGAIFYIFSTSSRTWFKVREAVELKESAQILMTRLERLLRASSIKSVEIIQYPSGSSSDALSFLSVYDEGGMATYNDSLSEMNWQEYVIFYLEDDPAVNPSGYYRLCSRSVFLGGFLNDYPCDVLSKLPYPPETSVTNTFPMIDYVTGSVEPPDTYITSPRVVTRNITQLNFNSHIDTRKVEIFVKIGKPAKDNELQSPPGQEKLEMGTSVVLRNR